MRITLRVTGTRSVRRRLSETEDVLLAAAMDQSESETGRQAVFPVSVPVPQDTDAHGILTSTGYRRLPPKAAIRDKLARLIHPARRRKHSKTQGLPRR